MSHQSQDETSATMAREDPDHGTDGALDRVLRLGQKQKCVPAIFIHAGAGFHSHQNEHVHLEACVAAAEMGIRFLRAGATATEAVEASLRILEDKEITNAGYGSNLSIDGTVECDATIVDHLGRSGACGAVPNIRNPISLAKLILDTSNKPLSLRRVPPNALVGDGAKAFAEEHGMVTVPNEYLVSKNSRDRFLRWQDDLRLAQSKTRDTRSTSTTSQTNVSCVPCQYDTTSPLEPQRTFHRDHTAALMAGTWNEGQPDSPYAGTPLADSPTAPLDYSVIASAYGSSAISASQPPLSPSRLPVTPTPSGNGNHGVFSPIRQGGQENNLEKSLSQTVRITDRSKPDTPTATDQHDVHHPASPSLRRNATLSSTRPNGKGQRSVQSPRGLKRRVSSTDRSENAAGGGAKRLPRSAADEEDHVTDTIGAIAIDEKGQIAAGSSSGGIGMKHRGRLGPAALVGIGTAVVPCADDDEEGQTVAAVTSGTGEHMATTMASQRCAERIFSGTRRGPGGIDVQDDDEDAVMESFITNDFMNHPGVRNCHSAGAIGVMVVRKSRTGYYLYFAHNTDSFALASMGGKEKEPRCTMSRLSEGAKVAKGGRKIRLD